MAEEEDLNNHPAPVKVELIATCPECGKKFFGSRSTGGVISNYHRHLLVHGNIRPFECDECDLTFKTNCNLKRHKRNMHRAAEARLEEGVAVQREANAGRFQCDDCPKHYASKWSLTQHQRRFHWDQQQESECDDCGQLLSSASKLTRHKKYHCIFRDDVGGGGGLAGGGQEDASDAEGDAEDEHAESDENPQEAPTMASSSDDLLLLLNDANHNGTSIQTTPPGVIFEEVLGGECDEPAATSSSSCPEVRIVDLTEAAAATTGESDIDRILGLVSLRSDRDDSTKRKHFVKSNQRGKRNRSADEEYIEGKQEDGGEKDGHGKTHHLGISMPRKSSAPRRQSRRQQQSALYFCGEDPNCTATFRHKRNLNAHVRKHHCPSVRPKTPPPPVEAGGPPPHLLLLDDSS